MELASVVPSESSLRDETLWGCHGALWERLTSGDLADANAVSSFLQGKSGNAFPWCEGEPLEVFFSPSSQLSAGASHPSTPQPHPQGCRTAADPIAEGEPRWCGRGGRGDAAGWWPLHKGLSVCDTPAVPRPSFRPSFLIPGPVKGLFVRRRRWLAPDTGSRAAFFALEAARARRSCSRA